MVNVSKMFLLAGSLCLVSPVMACDDISDDEDTVSTPVAYESEVSTQQKSQRSASFEEILRFSKELAGMDDGDYDDGDYAAAPETSDTKAPLKQEKLAKSNNKPEVKMTKKKVDNKAKVYALKKKWNSRSTIDPFE